MLKKLNTKAITVRLDELGYSQSDLSRLLNVTRTSVSQWFNGETFPRPAKLLRLGQVLSLKFPELVIGDTSTEPVIAFRKVAHSVTKESHIKRAREMGFALEQLVPHLPYETVTKPFSLNNPTIDYKYIQTAVKIVRGRLGISQVRVEESELIRFFSESNTILIPLLLDSKNSHENALHIYLPYSATNWVYINLNTNVLDFKFWLVHELGHILTPGLSMSLAEDFADNFAGAFLYPEDIASSFYNKVSSASSVRSQINKILDEAKRYQIAPYTILLQINAYARHNDMPVINAGKMVFANQKNLFSELGTVSYRLFGKLKPQVSDFISVTSREFNTVFFDTLRLYIFNNPVSASYIRSVLNLSVADSLALFNYLKYGVPADTN